MGGGRSDSILESGRFPRRLAQGGPGGPPRLSAGFGETHVNVELHPLSGPQGLHRTLAKNPRKFGPGLRRCSQARRRLELCQHRRVQHASGSDAHRIARSESRSSRCRGAKPGGVHLSGLQARKRSLPAGSRARRYVDETRLGPQTVGQQWPSQHRSALHDALSSKVQHIESPRIR